MGWLLRTTHPIVPHSKIGAIGRYCPVVSALPKPCTAFVLQWHIVSFIYLMARIISADSAFPLTKLERHKGFEPLPGRWKRLMLPLNTNVALVLLTDFYRF